MRVDFWTVGQWGLLLSAVASLVVAAPPVARHTLGIVVLEQPAQRQAAPLAMELQDTDLTAVLALAPFGRAVASGPEIAGSSTEGHPDMALKGVFSAPDGGNSSALIAISEDQAFYGMGDLISADLRLLSIAADHVVIAAPDGTITLYFDQAAETELAASAANVKETGALNDQLRSAVVIADRNQRAGAPQTTEDYISYWRRKIRKNPQAVLETIGLEPADDGYRIAQTHNRGVRLAGLQAGDLVRSVNGRAVGNPDEDRGAYDQIAASGHARLEVQRGNKTLTFSFPLR
ncbi:type II secretion system protein N [uncultured Roseobacter sp.]|uniref:type II secretion system protein N n=1 Tax=uncultured Roseobacter sp. TaxID=114847 RepID=UPI00261779F0|nr:type II secretion system protein N [uncultured Roseobacter sp.]